ncbi:GNAT family N-acetyltransferase [Rhodospirillum sp. A1_3_36]|uniref:GNAT family N-acetyltransferase n=1 Tax=Rhodospirillum sp. A1_3_36 TaxID=3391666 RepID=UPI0039A73234
MAKPLDQIVTDRLVLRPWRWEDRAPMARMNADPEVCRHLPAPLNREESDALVDRIEAHWRKYGFGPWVVTKREAAFDPGGETGPRTGPMIGFVGLLVPRFSAPFTPCVEIGWRLNPAHWGQGLATEAAAAVLAEDAFAHHGFEEVVAFTVPDNMASRRVMEKLGMTRTPADDFFHPLLALDDPSAPHVLYRMKRR